MYIFMHQCIRISLYMYILCMHVSVYVCMYHTYVYDACMYAMNVFFIKLRLLIFFNGLVRGPGPPIDPPLVRMHRGIVT